VTTLLAGALALQLYTLIADARLLVHGVPIRAAPARPARSPEVAARQIIAAHLFGAAAAESTPGEAADSMLLTLLGTLATEDPSRGFAIIRSGDSKAHMVAANHEIDPGTQLLQVFPDRAIVSWRGEQRVLAFPRANKLLDLFAQRTVPKGNVTAAAADDEEADEQPGTPAAPRHTADFPIIRDNIDYNPRMVGNQIGGMEITSVKDAEKLTKIGLQEGDVVTAMDGHALNSTARINELLMSLSHGATVTATILRDGQVSTTVLKGE
jgi:general secretion pathway protein C